MSAQVIAGPWIEAPAADAPKHLFKVTVKLTSGRTVDFEGRFADSFDAYGEALERYEHSADRIEIKPVKGVRHAAA